MSVSSILGGVSDNTGSGIARRLGITLLLLIPNRSFIFDCVSLLLMFNCSVEDWSQCDSFLQYTQE